jgi:hypothetical protein
MNVPNIEVRIRIITNSTEQRTLALDRLRALHNVLKLKI